MRERLNKQTAVNSTYERSETATNFIPFVVTQQMRNKHLR